MTKSHMSASHEYEKNDINDPGWADYLQKMPDLDMVLARNVRLIREALKMTQEEFADALGVTQGGVSRMETGESFSRFKKLDEQLRQAGADPKDLLLASERGRATDAVSARIHELLLSADPDVREMILQMLERLVVGSKTQGALHR